MEENLHQDSRVTVTTARVIIDGVTYALRNITSVHAKDITKPKKPGCSIILMIIAAFGVLSALSAMGDSVGGGLVMLLIFGGIGFAAFMWYQSMQDKHTYSVHIVTSGGETDAMPSSDQAYIQKIVAAINEAIVRYK